MTDISTLWAVYLSVLRIFGLVKPSWPSNVKAGVESDFSMPQWSGVFRTFVHPRSDEKALSRSR